MTTSSTGDPEAGTAVYVYENPLALPVCYPTYEDYINFDFKEYENPFDEQNALLSALFGYDEIVEFYKPYRYEYMLDENIETKKYGQGYTKYYPEVEGRDTTLSYIIKGNGYPTRLPSDTTARSTSDRQGFHYTYQDGNEAVTRSAASPRATPSVRITVLTEVYLKNEYVYYLDTELVSSASPGFSQGLEVSFETKLNDRHHGRRPGAVHLHPLRARLACLRRRRQAKPTATSWSAYLRRARAREIVLKFLPNYYIRACLFLWRPCAVYPFDIPSALSKKGWRLPSRTHAGHEGD